MTDQSINPVNQQKYLHLSRILEDLYRYKPIFQITVNLN